ncbi:MAG: pyruvate, phosphate dikinase, partial [Alphaproteobacteria bacterium]|nr:pyruvate, phosphate dikinase [Alphaproteobacteria bacterium]
MQKHVEITDFTEITPSAPISAAMHGGRAKCLQRLIRLEMPVPHTVALSFPAVRAIATGQMPDIAMLVAIFCDAPILSVRPSSQDPDWGGPGEVLN